MSRELPEDLQKIIDDPKQKNKLILGVMNFYIQAIGKEESPANEAHLARAHLHRSRAHAALGNESASKTDFNIFTKKSKLAKNILPVNDSPVANIDNVKEILNNITPGKKWGANLGKSMAWLEVTEREEAEKIISHFKENGYSDIKLMHHQNTHKPVVTLTPLNFTKLKTINPMDDKTIQHGVQKNR